MDMTSGRKIAQQMADGVVEPVMAMPKRAEPLMEIGQFDPTLDGLQLSQAPTGSILRSLMTFFGVVLCLAAFGLWLVPEAVATPASQVIRAGLTFLFIGAGFALYCQGRMSDVATTMELDLRSGELRQVAVGQTGRAEVISRYALADLNCVSTGPGEVCLRSAAGQELICLHGDAASQVSRFYSLG